jgi:ribosomal protein L11 methyltransferase
VWL